MQSYERKGFRKVFLHKRYLQNRLERSSSVSSHARSSIVYPQNNDRQAGAHLEMGKRLEQTMSNGIRFYTFFSVAFTIYAICILYVGRDLKNALWAKVFLSGLLLAQMFPAAILLLKEWIPIRTYVQDGRVLLPNDGY